MFTLNFKKEKTNDNINNNTNDKSKKRMTLLILLITIIVCLIGGGIWFFVYSTNHVTPKQLLQINFGKADTESSPLASIQKFTAEIKTKDASNNLKLSLENRRDVDTDHMKIKIASPVNIDYEMYVTKVDLKYAVYNKPEYLNTWHLEYKTKNVSDDDARTTFTESNNEINLTDIKLSSFENIEFDNKSNEKFYIVKGTTTYNNVLTIIDNIRQALLLNDAYNNNFFIQNGKNLKVNVIMKFNKTDKLLKSITFTSDESSLKDCINNYKSINPDVDILNFEYELINESYEKSDIYVPNEVDLNAVKIK